METPAEPLFPQETQTSPRPAAPGLLDQIVGAFTGPAELFDRLGGRPAWVAPYFLMASLSLVFALTWVFRLDWLAFIAEQAEKAGKAAQAIPESALPFIKAVGVVQMVALCFGGFLLFGLILWGLGRWLSQDRVNIRFGHAMTALTAPSLVKLPAVLLGTMSVAFRAFDTQTPEKLLPTSVGFYLHVENPKLQALLHSLDPFAIAFGVLGYMALRRILKFSPAVAVSLLVVYNLLLTLLPILKAR